MTMAEETSDKLPNMETTLKTWDKSAASAVYKIYDALYKIADWSPDLQKIRDRFDVYECEMSDPNSLSGMWIDSKTLDEETFWAQLGQQSIAWGKTQGYTITASTLCDTLIRKQKDYGHHNIAKFGLTGLIVRVHDKIARLENLIATKKEPGNESILDTVLDIAGYSAIGIMWGRNEFLLPLET